MSDNPGGTLAGKTCLVTGATAGLGLATARELARQGARVVLAARDAAKGEAVRAAIRQATGSDALEVLHVDLASLASVRAAARRFLDAHDRLHVLISNAAVFTGARRETADGFETMFAVNYLAPFLLTNLLLPTITASAPARIFVVTFPRMAGSSTSMICSPRATSSRRSLMSAASSATCSSSASSPGASRAPASPSTATIPVSCAPTSCVRAAYRAWRSMRSWAPRRTEVARKLVEALTSPHVAHLNGTLLKGDAQHETSPYMRNSRVQRQLWDATTPLIGL